MVEKNMIVFDPLADAEEKKKRWPYIFFGVGIGIILLIIIYFKISGIISDKIFEMKYIRENASLDSMLGNDWEVITWNKDGEEVHWEKKHADLLHDMLKNITITSKNPPDRSLSEQAAIKVAVLFINGREIGISSTNYITLDGKTIYKIYNYDGRLYDAVTELMDNVEDEIKN